MTDLISRSKLLSSFNTQLKLQKLLREFGSYSHYGEGIIEALEVAVSVISIFPAEAPEVVQVPTEHPERLQLLEDLYEAARPVGRNGGEYAYTFPFVPQHPNGVTNAVKIATAVDALDKYREEWGDEASEDTEPGFPVH